MHFSTVLFSLSIIATGALATAVESESNFSIGENDLSDFLSANPDESDFFSGNSDEWSNLEKRSDGCAGCPYGGCSKSNPNPLWKQSLCRAKKMGELTQKLAKLNQNKANNNRILLSIALQADAISRKGPWDPPSLKKTTFSQMKTALSAAKPKIDSSGSTIPPKLLELLERES